MKKRILFIVFFMPCIMMAQASVYIGCYKNGDTISTYELQRIFNNKDNSTFYTYYGKKCLQSWKMEVKYKGGDSITFYPNVLTSFFPTSEMKIKMIGTDIIVPEKIILREVTLNVTKSGVTRSIVMPDQIFYRTKKKTRQSCGFDSKVFKKNEDLAIKVNDFKKSEKKEIIAIENIYYAINSAEIQQESFATLDKIIESMLQNKNLKLNIASFTDSKGDDIYNMELSQKRTQKVINYFIEKSIDPNRLTGKGYGKIRIVNRCKNNIECSEQEQKLNRRTEFSFTQ